MSKFWFYLAVPINFGAAFLFYCMLRTKSYRIRQSCKIYSKKELKSNMI